MIVYNKSKNRRSFTVGKQRFDLVNGDNTVPESKEMIKFVSIHPDLTIIKDRDEPKPVELKKKKVKKNKFEFTKKVIKEKPIDKTKEIDNSNQE